MENEARRQRLEALNRKPLAPAAWPRDEELHPKLEDLRRQIEPVRKTIAKQVEATRQRAAATPPPLPRPAKPAATPPPLPRGPRRTTPAVKPPEKLSYRRALPRAAKPAGTGRTAAPGEPLGLEAGIAGEVLRNAAGNAFCVTTPVREVAAEFPRVFRDYEDCILRAESAFRRRLARKEPGPDPLDPAHVIYMDIETTGLSNSPLFLIGCMTWDSGNLVVRQFFARDYSEEAAVIAHFDRLMAGRQVLVTFNGKSFDLPYIRGRAVYHRLPCANPAYHFDLLHESRRIWRGELPNCRLQTIETEICGRPRHGDIPGSEIPDAYHRYVHSGDAREMVTVLNHNLLDVVTLGEIVTRLPPLETPPPRGRG